ncbi:MAG TPA: phosphoesterase [Candidatus Dormibacteraeota bacterium]|nr:phosphoesterase [Candidatus Dormibacteraeota bacterium]
MNVRLCYHDKCFDGAASAAVFMRFYRERFDPAAAFHFHGLVHRASQLFSEETFDGDENVIVDFKYSSSPRLTWWFDHHQSAFLSQEDAEHFRADRSGHKFYDPTYKSCTKFLATVASTKFGFDARPLEELIRWGDMIDGAQYESAEKAVALAEPATQLALVIEAAPDPGLVARLIPLLTELPLPEIVRLPFIHQHLGPLLERHRRSIDILKERTQASRGVIYFDVSDLDLEGYNKFVPYYLFPECLYSVGVSSSSTRAKVSVGSNPWKEADHLHNLAEICERYNGGGHARVAAISFGAGEIEQARQAAREITAILRS